MELNPTQSARLLREPDLSVRKAIDICTRRAADTSGTQMKNLTDEKSLDFVRKKGQSRPKHEKVKKGNHLTRKETPMYNCRKCGYLH